MLAPRSILITGASSGIGEALALHYAKAGTRLCLGGRNAERLESVAATCREKGASVECWVGDVVDAQGVRTWIESADARQALDLVIANAGVAVGATEVGGLHSAAVDSFTINVGGVFNTVHPAIEVMSRRDGPARGQIAIMSSVMGYLGTARSPAYSSSKAAVKAYGESLRGALRHLGIGVSVICPGYVASGMITRSMPFLLPADTAAAIIARGLARNRARITFPWQVSMLARLAINLPQFLLDRLNKPYGVSLLKPAAPVAETNSGETN